MAPQQKLPITDVIEIVDLGLELVATGQEIAADKKVDFNDLQVLFKRFPALAAAGTLAIGGAENVIPQLKDLDEVEAGQVASHVIAKLAISDAKARKIVDRALKAAAANYALVQAILEPAEEVVA